MINRYKQIRQISEFGESEKEMFQKLKTDLIEKRQAEINVQLDMEFMAAGHKLPEDLTDYEEALAYVKDTIGDSFKPAPSSDELFNLLGLEEEMDTSR